MPPARPGLRTGQKRPQLTTFDMRKFGVFFSSGSSKIEEPGFKGENPGSATEDPGLPATAVTEELLK